MPHWAKWRQNEEQRGLGVINKGVGKKKWKQTKKKLIN